MGEERDAHEEEADYAVRNHECRGQDRKSLAEQKLLAADGSGEHRLERPLLLLADHRGGGDRSRHHRWYEQQKEQTAELRVGRALGQDQEDSDNEVHQRHERHGPDDGAVAPVVSQLFVEDGPDARRTQVHSEACLFAAVNQLEVHVFQRMARLIDGEHIGARRHESPGDLRGGDSRVRDGEEVGTGSVQTPTFDRPPPAEDTIGLGERERES